GVAAPGGPGGRVPWLQRRGGAAHRLGAVAGVACARGATRRCARGRGAAVRSLPGGGGVRVGAIGAGSKPGSESTFRPVASAGQIHREKSTLTPVLLLLRPTAPVPPGRGRRP